MASVAVADPPPLTKDAKVVKRFLTLKLRSTLSDYFPIEKIEEALYFVKSNYKQRLTEGNLISEKGLIELTSSNGAADIDSAKNYLESRFMAKLFPCTENISARTAVYTSTECSDEISFRRLRHDETITKVLQLNDDDTRQYDIATILSIVYWIYLYHCCCISEHQENQENGSNKVMNCSHHYITELFCALIYCATRSQTITFPNGCYYDLQTKAFPTEYLAESIYSCPHNSPLFLNVVLHHACYLLKIPCDEHESMLFGNLAYAENIIAEHKSILENLTKDENIIVEYKNSGDLASKLHKIIKEQCGYTSINLPVHLEHVATHNMDHLSTNVHVLEELTRKYSKECHAIQEYVQQVKRMILSPISDGMVEKHQLQNILGTNEDLNINKFHHMLLYEAAKIILEKTPQIDKRIWFDFKATNIGDIKAFCQILARESVKRIGRFASNKAPTLDDRTLQFIDFLNVIIYLRQHEFYDHNKSEYKANEWSKIHQRFLLNVVALRAIVVFSIDVLLLLDKPIQRGEQNRFFDQPFLMMDTLP